MAIYIGALLVSLRMRGMRPCTLTRMRHLCTYGEWLVASAATPLHCTAQAPFVGAVVTLPLRTRGSHMPTHIRVCNRGVIGFAGRHSPPFHCAGAFCGSDRHAPTVHAHSTHTLIHPPNGRGYWTATRHHGNDRPGGRRSPLSSVAAAPINLKV